ncbi:MAG: transcriptional regulator [Planctomycetaceae bacterium]|nr:transcriptional regulator [Planctomycetaceae bacterium]
MSSGIMDSDVTILDVLRKQGMLTVAELSGLLSVTGTAVRQRLTRLLAEGYIDRKAVRPERGRPFHQYSLTTKGRRRSGQNFADLAIVLWDEIRLIEDVEVQQGLMQRISRRLADMYTDRVQGQDMSQRLAALTELFADRRLPIHVDHSGELPVLSIEACPYPEIAEHDRSVCSMEKMLFSEVLGESVKLAECRLDGACSCTFQVTSTEIADTQLPIV